MPFVVHGMAFTSPRAKRPTWTATCSSFLPDDAMLAVLRAFLHWYEPYVEKKGGKSQTPRVALHGSGAELSDASAPHHPPSVRIDLRAEAVRAGLLPPLSQVEKGEQS